MNKLEEKQFQSYAKDIIDEAIVKKRNPFPLRKAADAGAGGGRGPEFAGVGGKLLMIVRYLFNSIN